MKMIKLCLLCLLGILTGTVRLAAQDVIPPQLTPQDTLRNPMLHLHIPFLILYCLFPSASTM